MGLDNTCLVTLAMMEGFNFQADGTVRVDALRWSSWHKELITFLLSQQNLFHESALQ